MLVLWALRAVNVALTPRFVPRLPKGSAGRAPASFVSVVVPARNEARDIRAATLSKLAQDDGSFEVVVVDDRSEDGTGRILAELASSDPRLVVVNGVEPPADWLGKPHALHQGAAAARARERTDWLLFADADVHFSPDAVRRATAFAEQRGVAFLTLMPRLVTESFAEKLLIAAVPDFGFAYFPGWAFNVPALRRWGGGAGAFNLIRRGLYDDLGGHAALRNSVVDDIQLGRSAKKSGAPCLLALGLDAVSVRMYHGFRETLNGFTKNGYFGLGANVLLALLLLAGFTAEGLLPFAVLAAFLAGVPVPETPLLLAAAGAASALLVRASVQRLLGYSSWVVLLHPVWVIAVAFVFLRSTVLNGVLGRNVWRGRVRDVRTLRI